MPTKPTMLDKIVAAATRESNVDPTALGNYEEPPIPTQKPLTQPRSASAILYAAHDILDNRAKQYPGTVGERSMARAIEAFNAVTGKDLTTTEGNLLLVCVKLVRFCSSPVASTQEDSVLDAINYLALGLEADK